MKRRWGGVGLSWLILTLAAIVSQAELLSGAPLKVMSFNIRGDFDLEQATNSSEAWNSISDQHRRDLVVRTIASFEPDLLGVQEAFQHQLVDLKNGLPGYEFSGVGRDDGKQAGEHSAIFYRTSHFRLVSEGSFWLSNSPDEPGSIFPGAGYTRIASWVILADGRLGDREMFVLNTHWDHVSELAHQHSATLIRSRIAALAGGRPTIVMGDLNDSEDSPSLKTLLGAAKDGPQLSDSFRDVVPQRGANEATYHAFQGSPAGSRIDYILHSGEWRATAAAIVRAKFDDRYPSDHFPVTAILEPTQEATTGAEIKAPR